MIYATIDNTDIQSISYEKTINSDGKIIGTCELGKCEIQLLNDSNEYNSYKGKWLHTPFGSMYIYDVKPVQEKVNISLSCYDIKYKLEQSYDASLFEFDGITFGEWREMIAEEYGITFADSGVFPNYNLVQLYEHPYVGENPTVRSVLMQLAEACGCFIDTDFNDNFYFNWFDSNASSTINDWIELTTETPTNPVNVVVLGRGDVEDNVHYPTSYPSNPVEFRIDNNYILDPQDPDGDDYRLDYAEEIYNEVNGFSFTPYKLRTRDITNINNLELLGRKITYVDIWGNTVNTYSMTVSFNYLGSTMNNLSNYEIGISAEEVKNTSKEHLYSGDVVNEIHKTGVYVDRINNQVVLKVDGNGKLVTCTLSTDPDSGSSFVVKSDNIDLSGKNIRLTTDNITISSTKFNVDKDGNLVCNGATMNNISIVGGDITLTSQGQNARFIIQDSADSNARWSQSARTINWKGVQNGQVQITNYLSSPVMGLVDGSDTSKTIALSPYDLSFNQGTIKVVKTPESTEKVSQMRFITGSSTYLELSTAYGAYGVNVWASDKRLKKNIKDSTLNALDIINKIKHREFYYKSDDKYIPIGYVADELKEIDENMVFEVGNKKMKQPNAGYIIPILSKAIQEQQEEIVKLKYEIEKIKKEMEVSYEKNN